MAGQKNFNSAVNPFTEFVKLFPVIILLLPYFQPAYAEISVASDSSIGIYSLSSVLSTGENEMIRDGYVLYNELQVVDPGREVTVRLIYYINPPEIDGYTGKFEDFKGSAVTIRGKNYFVTDVQSSKITLGEGYTELTLLKQAVSDAKIAKPFAGNVKVLITGSQSDTAKMGMLRVFEDDKEVGDLDLDTGKSGSSFSNRSELTPYLQEITKQLGDYLIFLTNSKPIKITVIKKDRLFDIMDEQKKVLGYESVRVNNPNFKGGTNKIKFLDKTYALKIETSMPLEEADYYILRLNENRRFWIDVGYIPPATTAPPTTPAPTTTAPPITTPAPTTTAPPTTTPPPIANEGQKESEKEVDLNETKSIVADFLNQAMGSYSLLKSVFGNERINVFITAEDRNEPTAIAPASASQAEARFSVVMRDGKVEDISENLLEDQTMNVFVSKETINQLLAQEITPLDALGQGKIRYEGIGFVNSMKARVLNFASGIIKILQQREGGAPAAK